MGAPRNPPDAKDPPRRNPDHVARSIERHGKVARRARRILEIWADQPSLSRSQVKGMIRREFQCGIGAADLAVEHALELYRQAASELALTDRIAVAYWHGIEESQRKGDWRAYFRGLDSLRAHLGLGAPERLEITNKVGEEDMAELTEAQIALLEELDLRRATRGGEDAPPEPTPETEH